MASMRGEHGGTRAGAASDPSDQRIATDPRTGLEAAVPDRGIAALLAAVVTPIVVAVFAAWPPPYDDGAVKWFELLQDSPVPRPHWPRSGICARQRPHDPGATGPLCRTEAR